MVCPALPLIIPLTGISVNVGIIAACAPGTLVTIAVNVTELFGAVLKDGLLLEVTTVVVAALATAVVIVMLQPVIEPVSPALSSATYRLQVPLGLMPLICAGAAMLLSAALYRIRMTQMRKRFVIVAEERFAERSRIAREIHDTLLQGLTGASLVLRAAVSKVSDGDFLARLGHALQDIEHTVADTREAIWNMRRQTTDASRIAEALKHTELALQPTPVCNFDLAQRVRRSQSILE